MSLSLMAVSGSPSIRRIFQVAFPLPEFEVFLLGSGENAVQTLERFVPDIIFLDMFIREPDGYELARVLNNHPVSKNCPLFLLAGAFGSLDEERLEKIDYEDVIQQPFDSGALAARIGHLWSRDVLESLPEDPLSGNILPGRETDNDPKGPPSSQDGLSGSRPGWINELKAEILEELKEWLRGQKAQESGEKGE